MDYNTQVIMKSKAESFFSELFAFRTDVHLAHLCTDSYAKHIALNELYDGILSLTDDLIESYQGKNGLVNLSVRMSTTNSCLDCCELIYRIMDYLIENRLNIGNDSPLQNIVDELIDLVYKTKYKLENLK